MPGEGGTLDHPRASLQAFEPGDTPASPARHVFATLDGMRGIAAIAVVTFHYRDMLGPWVFRSAYLAVDLFFLLSGIVIAHAYERRLLAGVSARRFMTMRALRLMPLYLVGLSLGVGVALLGIALGQSNWTWSALLPVALSGALMIPNLFPAPRADLYPLDIPCWSLFWELVINLIYAVSLRWLRTGVVIAILVMAHAALAFSAWRAGGLDFGYDWQHPEIGFLRVTAGFFGGVWIARMHRTGRLWRLSLSPLLALLLAGGLLALPIALGWAKDIACVAVAFPLLCVAALQSEPRRSAPYLWLGLISYPLYVVHATLPWSRLADKLLHVSPERLEPLSGLVAMAGAVIVAWCLAVFYDLPVRRWLSRRSPG